MNQVLFGLKPKEFNKNDFKYKYIGTPVREDIIRLSGLKNTGKKNDIFTIFVLGGSQGAKVLTNSFLSSLSFFPKDKLNKIFIYIQCREEEKNKVKKILKNFHIKFTVSTFFDDIGVVINNSDLIISRAGASTLSELIICKKINSRQSESIRFFQKSLSPERSSNIQSFEVTLPAKI